MGQSLDGEELGEQEPELLHYLGVFLGMLTGPSQNLAIGCPECAAGWRGYGKGGPEQEGAVSPIAMEWI